MSNKRGIILIFGLLLLASIFSVYGAAEPTLSDDIILRISSPTNAHGEVWNGTAYSINITYSGIFGSGSIPYIGGLGGDLHNCTGNNVVLRLSNITNAHAQKPYGYSGGDLYGTPVCYGNLNCTYKTGDCNASKGEKCVVTLSDATNAHLANCTGSSPYSNKICCALAVAPAQACNTYPTKAGCWSNPSQNCTWTPPVNSTTGNLTTNNADGGHCCANGQVWNSDFNRCDPTSGLCTIPWITGTTVQFNANGPFRYNNGQYQYCAQVTAGVNYGMWYPCESY